MDLVTVDVVLCLPEPLRRTVLIVAATLAERMAAAGHPSGFQLGRPFPGGGDAGDPGAGGDTAVCEPHVSLFMLAVPAERVEAVVAAVGSVARRRPAVRAQGVEYRHNPSGAPELFYRRGASWFALQRAVVDAVEPLREGRLRPVDPAGVPLAGLVDRLRRTDPDGPQLAQLLRYGYDEVTDGHDDRFHPHVTLAWPVDPYPVDLAGLTAPELLGGTLSDLAVYGMRPNGTCTRRYGGFALRRSDRTDQPSIT